MTCKPRGVLGIVISQWYFIERDNLQPLSIDPQVCGQVR